jgi:Golgi phosphoprotein 3 (GPP34)
MEMLIAEDLLLLLMDDEKGRLAATSQARPLFGGALLIELALAGTAEMEEKRGYWHVPKVSASSPATPGLTQPDPLLARAWATIAEKPRSAQDLVQRLGKGVREELQDRLVAKGILERRERRVLGLFPAATWPALDLAHEREVRDRLHAVLVQGLTPDPRTAALVALLAAVDQAHRVVPPGDLKASELKRRAKAVSEGAWAAKAVRDAVAATQTAITTAVIASTAASTSGG